MSQSGKTNLISPNFRLTSKRPNENMFEASLINKKPKIKKIRILNEFKRKEENWDARFVNHNIPEYSCINDVHCEGYSKFVMKKRKNIRYYYIFYCSI